MKIRIITLLLILFSTYSFAQDDQDEYNKLFWNSNGKYDKTTEIPEKWKKESAVVIFKNENYKFHKFGKRVTYTMSFRKRIKLLDKSAVEKYSEFSYDEDFDMITARKGYWKKVRIIGIKIIKPNGDESIIDIEKASVKEDEKTKVAIPNLEVGDILDYYLFLEEKIVSIFQFGFNPEEHTLASKYPTMHYKMTLTTENDFFINFNSYNGAPKLKKIASADKKIRKYEFRASDIEKVTGERWNYPLAGNPCYKFQVYFARSGKFEDMAFAFLPEKENIIKTKVSKAEVLELYDKKYRPTIKTIILNKYAKEKGLKNKAKMVEDTYYYMRYYYFTRYLEAAHVEEAEILYSPFTYYKNAPLIAGSNYKFIREFTSFLKTNKIGYEVIIAKGRYDGPIEDLLLQLNTKAAIRTKTDPPVYLSLYETHTSTNTIDPAIEGTKAYALTISSFKTDASARIITLPSTDYKQNNNTQTAFVKLNKDFSGLEYDVTNSYTGHLKDGPQSRHMYFGNYVYDDYKKYNAKPFLNFVEGKKRLADVPVKFKKLKEKIEKKLKERTKESTSNGFGFSEDIEDYTHKIIKTGRYGFEEPFTFQETFSVKNDFIKRAGKNYIIEIGMLINKQVDIKEKERNRNQDINMDFPRSYNNIIEFEIPDGYTVAGIEKLNKKIDNETGSFISTAKIVGNKLIINTSKNYKHNYETNANWPKMLAFLDEAFQFNNEKILLKKK